jgi:hypothetical protein
MVKKSSWKIFSSKGHPIHNVHLDWLEDYTSYAMADAFKEVADTTVEKCRESPRHPDRYFYPVAYLYRHHLELVLKNLIELGHQLDEEPKCKSNAQGHNLQALWADAIEVINVVFPNDDRSELAAAAAVVDELHRADPDGQSFRYYRNKNGVVNLTVLPRVLSLEQLRDGIQKLSAFLSGCCIGVSMAVDWQQEGRSNSDYY